MSHLSDKDLDHLARESAEHLDVDQNSSGWDSLEKKLDIEMPVEKRRRRWLLFLIFPLLGSIFFIAYRMNNKDTANPGSITQNEKSTNSSTTSNAHPNKEKTDQTNESSNNPSHTKEHSKATSSAPELNDATVASPVGNRTDPKTLQPAEPDLSTPGRSNLAQAANDNKSAASTMKTTSVRKRSSSVTAATTAETRYQSSKSTQSIANSKSKRHIPSSDEQSTTAMSTDKEEDEVAPPATAVAQGQSNTEASADTTTESVAKIDSSVASTNDSNIVASVEPKKKSTGKNKRKTLMPEKGFAWGIATGPDVSEVNRKGVDKVGTNFGVQLAYRLSGRMSVVSGVSYTHKFYTAQGADYYPPKYTGTFLDSVTLKKVVGDCFMYELPLNLRFDVIASRKNYLYTSVGLSSYFMKKENYDFHYTNNFTGSYGSNYLSYKVREKYWFKVLNFSVGYERMLKKRWSLQAEPYIKLPLDGIAFGRMQLNSYGLLLGVRYHTGSFKAR